MKTNRSSTIGVAMLSGVALSALAVTPALSQEKGGSYQLEEIVVKALKRDQTLQDVPAAVTVFSAQNIERMNINRPDVFIEMTPNVVISNSNHAGETLISIRGDAQTRNTEAPVAFVVDGVILTGRNQFSGELFDLQQIEILKGPQGYLYGRNAIAGAIVITTKAPTNEFEASASMGYGTGEEVKSRFMLSGPVIEDELFVRLSGSVTDRRGYFENITRGDFEDPFNEKVGRARVIWTPTSNLSVDLRAGASRVVGGGIQWAAQSLIPGLQVSPEAANLNVNDIHDVPFVRNVDSRNKQTKEFLAAKIDYDFDIGTVTSVSTYDRTQDVFAGDDFPYLATEDTTQFNVVNHEAFSQELRFTSNTEDRLNYIFGGYYANIDNKPNLHAAIGVDPGGFVLDAFEPILSGPNQTVSFISDEVMTEVFAAFAIVTYDITEDLELTLAGRFDREEKKTIDVAPPAFSATSGLVRENTFEEFQPKVNLSWKVNPDVTIYGGYARGFQAGGFNGAQTFQRTGGAAPNDFGASTADNFEGGFKSLWLDGSLTLNGAVFYNIKKNAQQFQFIPDGTLNAVISIDEIEIFGAELETSARITDQLSLTGGIGYLDSEVTEFDLDPTSIGNRAPFVPKLTGSLSLTHVWNLGKALGNDELELVSNVSYEYRGNQFFNADNTPGTKRESLNLIDARVALEAPNWTFAVWGKNLTDKLYAEDVIPIFTEEPLTTFAAFRSAPRTVGVEATFRF